VLGHGRGIAVLGQGCQCLPYQRGLADLARPGHHLQEAARLAQAFDEREQRGALDLKWHRK
jgi:hypothetical protein